MGDPIAHSLSPAMHNAAIAALGLDATYVALRTTHKAFPALVAELLENGGGCSVTRPFKDDAFALEGEHTALARRTRAVNCIALADAPTHRRTGAPRMLLDNTDVAGVQGAVRELLGDAPVKVARIFGTGGAARAAAVALDGMYPGLTLEVASRSADRARAFAAWGAEEGIVIGTDPDIMTALDLMVWATPQDVLLDTSYRVRTPGVRATYDPPPPPPVFDMNYRRGGTTLTKLQAMQPGFRGMDGRAMLVHQGVAAFERWFGVTPPIDVMRRAVEDALAG